jgi:polyisoprenoid-binding protein YceI
MSGLKRYILTVLFFVLVSGVNFAGVEYGVDKAHSSISFTISHMVISKVRGNFDDFSVKVVEDEKDLTQSSIEVAIKANSISTRNDKRDNHLRSGDFFNVEKFPQITFKSKKIKKEGDKYALVGDLTMHGVSKEVTIPFTITGKIIDRGGKTRMGIEAFTILDRKDFGVNWNRALDKGGFVLGNQVTIEILLEMRSK